METCPHGSRIAVDVDVPVVFVDACATCERVLEETGFAGKVVPREEAPVVAGPAARVPALSVP